jgi:cytochrome c oxidase subunit 2
MAAVVLLGTAGCSADTEWGRLGMPVPATQQGQDVILPFWQNTWITAWIVGGITWGLMAWVVIVYRRRKGDGLPRQLQYNLPIEVLYTFTPVVIVLVLFMFTFRDTNTINDLTDDSQRSVGVVGFQWSWTFNYLDDGVYDTGTPEQPPTLWLPVDERIRFELTSPDVIHSFWVPAFLYKQDVVPGRLNQFEATPNRIGTYAGKCAELCGVDHSRMLFTVKIVSQQDYEAHMAALRSLGQTGVLQSGRVSTKSTGARL